VTYGTTYDRYIYIYIENLQQTRLCGARSGSPQLCTQSCIARLSLAAQTFAEKEHLVTIDRFTWHRGIQNVMSWQRSQRKNTIAVSIKWFYVVDDQKEMVVCCLCRSLATVKDMQLANVSCSRLKLKVLIM